MYSLFAVDDDALILDEVMTEIPWMETGFEVAGGETSPFRAEQEILRLRPDAVICDLKMPGMDGLELFHAVRAAGVDSAFVMLSAFGTFENSRSFFLAGGFDYVLKPVDKNEVQMVFERLARQLSDGQGQPDTGYAPVGVPGFDELVAYVGANYTKRFTLEQLGRQFHLSPNYICNLFSKHYNSTLTAFITDTRMKRAGELIREKNGETLKEIAFGCGYGNYFHFCKQFKSYYGVSPSVWRESAGAAGPGEAGQPQED